MARQGWQRAARPVTRGQAMVEFAFSFALFSMIFFGFLMGAIVLYGFVTANSAAREGAHLIITDLSTSDAAVENQVCATSIGLAGSPDACKNMLQIMPSDSGDAGYVPYQCPPASPPSDLLLWIEPEASHADQRIPGKGTIAVSVCYHVPIPTFSLPSMNGGRLYIFGPVWVAGRSVMAIPD